MKVIGRISSNKDVLQKSISKMNNFVERLDGVDYVQSTSVQGNNIICTVKAVK